MKYYIIVAEGVTDTSTVEAILEKALRYKNYKKYDDLPLIFKQMVGKYPNHLGELEMKGSPTFYNCKLFNIAVKQANGCNNISNTICNLLEVISKEDNFSDFSGFLVITDTDKKSKEELMDQYTKYFKDNNISLSNGELIYDEYNIPCLFHFIPKNGTGAIESLLLECSSVKFKHLFDLSERFREELLKGDYDSTRDEHWSIDKEVQTFYADKSQLGFISSILKPDRPVRHTIKDKLIRSESIDALNKISEFNCLYSFLSDNLT